MRHEGEVSARGAAEYLGMNWRTLMKLLAQRKLEHRIEWGAGSRRIYIHLDVLARYLENEREESVSVPRGVQQVQHAEP